MSNSIVIYYGRDDVMRLVDPDALPHFDDFPPLLDIVISVINAGYKGVVVDEKQLSNGRFTIGLSIVKGTPEGQIIQDLSVAVNEGKELPSIEFVMEQINKKYNERGLLHA